MKYKDKNLQVNSEFIPVVDKDRPVQALIDLFNPANNALSAQSQSLIIRVTGILHEFRDETVFALVYFLRMHWPLKLFVLQYKVL